MKKKVLIIVGIILVFVVFIIYKINSELDVLVEAFHTEHELNDSSFILLSDSVSPNGIYRYFEYQFDNGGLGYSRVFWSVVENTPDVNNLEIGILPDGYKAIGWTQSSELIITKWEPYYFKSKEVELIGGDEYNGVILYLKE